jgi:hypothetical protein
MIVSSLYPDIAATRRRLYILTLPGTDANHHHLVIVEATLPDGRRPPGDRTGADIRVRQSVAGSSKVRRLSLLAPLMVKGGAA